MENYASLVIFRHEIAQRPTYNLKESTLLTAIDRRLQNRNVPNSLDIVDDRKQRLRDAQLLIYLQHISKGLHSIIFYPKI